MPSLEFTSAQGRGAYIVKRWFREEETHSYDKDDILLGPQHRDYADDPDQLATISTREAVRILVLGSMGSGKTHVARGIFNRFFLGGDDNAVIIPCDIKPEYYRTAYPIQPKYHNKLLPTETPQGFPMECYKPYFLYDITKKKFSHPNHKFCQISLRDCTVYDLISVFAPLNPPQREALITAFQDMDDKGAQKNTENLVDIIQTSGTHAGVKRVILGKIQRAIRSGLIGEKYETFDFSRDIMQGKIPYLNLYGYANMGDEVQYPTAYVAIALRQLASAKKNNTIKKKRKILVVLDELERICPKEGELSSKTEILNGQKLLRSDRVSYLFMVKDTNLVPKEIFEHATHIILPHNVSLTEIKQAFSEKLPEEDEYPINFIRNMQQIRRDLKIDKKTKERDCLLINTIDKTFTIFRPLPPLSAEISEGDGY